MNRLSLGLSSKVAWRAVSALLAIGLVGGVASVLAQQPPPAKPQRPTFQANVDLTLVDLRVVDRDGKFVSGLTKDDFQVFEDDDAQSIETFSEITIPLPATTAAPAVPIVAPDVVSNANADEGRLYLIVLDDLEAETERKGQYQALRAKTVKEIARDFVENHMGPMDRAALIATSNRKELTVEFTSDRRRLLTAIDKFAGGFGQVSYGTFCGLQCVQLRDNIHSVMINLKALAGWLSTINGRRKAMVLVSERLGRSVKEVPEGVKLDVLAQEALDIQYFLEAAARANVSLYPIDPVGNPTGPKGNIKPLPLDDNAQFDLDRVMTLTTVSEATGGFATSQTNDFTTAFDRIVEENSSYYLLGYSSTNNKQDGKFRKIRVEVMQPGLKVRARSGYATEKPSERPSSTVGGLPVDLNALVRSPIPVSGLELSVGASAFRSSGGGSVGIVVEARPNQFLAGQGGRFNGSIEVAIVAADMSGRVQGGERGTLSMELSQGPRDTVAQRGVRLLSSIDLKPGDYYLSVAATTPGGGNAGGSVRYELTVPDFSAPLAMSGVAIGSLEASEIMTNGTDTRWKASLGMPPTATRVFQSKDELRVFAEVYDNDRRREHVTTVTTTIKRVGPTFAASGSGGDLSSSKVRSGDQRDQTIVFSKREDLPRLGGQTTFPTVTDISLTSLDPGDYVLTVEAKSSQSPNRPISRQIPFSVTSEP